MGHTPVFITYHFLNWILHTKLRKFRREPENENKQFKETYKGTVVNWLLPFCVEGNLKLRLQAL